MACAIRWSRTHRTRPTGIRFCPGTRDALERLRKEYAIAVISNADGRIDAVLRRCGIVDCFQSITDSGNVGHEKPHPAIFEAALREMKAEASREPLRGRCVFR